MKIKQLHISRTIKLIIFYLVIISCSNQELATTDLKEGKYVWKEQSFQKKLYHRLVNDITIFEVGDTLNLIDKENFYYIDCGNEGYGRYNINGDSLYLKYDSSINRSDGMTYYYDSNDVIDVYYIEDHKTISKKFRTKLPGEKEWSSYGLSELHYVEDTLKNEK